MTVKKKKNKTPLFFFTYGNGRFDSAICSCLHLCHWVLVCGLAEKDKLTLFCFFIQTHYFGLWFLSKSQQARWVELEKPLKKQLDKFANEPLLFFGVMFYVPSVSRLQQEVTRYVDSLCSHFCVIAVRDRAISLFLTFSIHSGITWFFPFLPAAQKGKNEINHH